jgi:hypothetical protein
MRLFYMERGYERTYSLYKEARMHGTDVVTIDGDKIGHVVDERDGFLIVEHGLLKSKHAIPQKCVETDEGAGVLRTTLSKSLVHDSPKVNGHFDREAIAEHYGLAEAGGGRARPGRCGLHGGALAPGADPHS